ncbi:T9SS type A sorting domain-containing protein [Spirosoma validum]|nr:T9SS type A sorting domain-containing protein [Spirosoma validum]
MTFTIGNNGTVPISGNGFANQMQWSICLGKCAPNNANPLAALSGDLLNYFNVSFTPPASTTNQQGGCFEATQKPGVAIPEVSVYNVVIAAVVTRASTTTTVNDIGASCNIAPNGTANPQPTDNDFASIYTHTNTLAMPVALVDFSAQAQENRTVLVNWKTSWEKANKGYIVERSKDLKSFEAVGEVNDVAGTSNSISSYRFVDNAPYRGTSYYRLRQVDLDGTSQTFDAKSVVIDGKYGVYPNPVVGQQFTLELDEPTQAVLHLYNASGSELGINKLDPTEVSTKVSPSSKLSTGVYILTVEERGITRKHRLVVQ